MARPGAKGRGPGLEEPAFELKAGNGGFLRARRWVRSSMSCSLSITRSIRKPSSGGPSTPGGGAKVKGRRPQGGRVVESRYLQYEKKTTKKASAADTLKTIGKMPEGGRKVHLLQRSRDSSGIGKGDLQSTLLEGHGTAPPDLDLSAINDKSMLRKTPQLEKTMSKKTESMSFSASQRKSPDLSEAMEMMESQTLLLTLLTVKMENGLAQFEEKAERNLLIMCKETEKLQKKAHELKRKLLLCQRKRELADVLDAQIEMLSPYEPVAERFREQYKTFATALDTTRHELPVKSVHLDGNGQQFLDDLQRELTTTCHLLGELGISSLEENVKALDLLSEIREMTQKKDLELRRSFAQVLELSAEASKEAALVNQEVWEDAQGLEASSQWYFNQEGACGEASGEVRTPLLLGTGEPHAV
ncbi:HAUS augmin-like complex subunit 8 isoform X2 [Canis lupus baileyi]|uniref:HAUS augmin-like complex subunit 8 isoform X2 n=1 Tax=Canis lupus familiaris TaxID=9615 RepID=UPI000BAA04DA|nr:HAUS augmin-like complex subunit 8 isoform X2 [Canis lupus familiaris]XP_025313738.1 HAUS augmin-like complex subunit 8 isoform X2 [Canis lupus dingo]XP_038284193.1 HAUS augmin-like complex subunit 8 isoform X2 [Canis lupus familiaris]XP_038422863.1 HAUS augmin-like complex subunit 8 isoform X2 [Canis lupus familiaris]|eukprot:XP_022262619.1 HAUS augmin-like complex subunit 8 isoform X2 [Canis lupus familiaris]